MRHYWFFILALVAFGCATQHPETRGQWWNVGKCNPVQSSQAYCDSKARTWGQL